MGASANETEEEGYRSSMGALFGSLDSKELGSVLLFLSSRELLAWREVSKVCILNAFLFHMITTDTQQL